MKRKIIIGTCALLGAGLIYIVAALGSSPGGKVLTADDSVRFEATVHEGPGTNLKPFPPAVADHQAEHQLLKAASVAEATVSEITPEAPEKPTPSATPKASANATVKVTAKNTAKTTQKTASTPASTPKPGTATSTVTTPPANSEGLAGKVIITAKKYLGVPYVWGGTSPSGFDCSGFIQYVYAQNGVTLPRTSAEQYGAGKSISKADLKPGDLVFFETYKPGPSHVGIYLGNSQFIHASSGSGKVMLSNLTSSYYTEHYIGSRRVLNQP